MNIGGIFAILDDVAATLDDVAVMSKVAAKKTAGILGDDLAVNANMSANFASNRELPVLWAITKGSFINKLIILPVAFLLSYFAPWIIPPILILGAIYLAYEGAEKIIEFLRHRQHESPLQRDLVDEAQKIKNAITTDFILSVEIVVIALGVVVAEPILNQILITTFIAILATVGVYGMVALLVRLDDIGFGLIGKGHQKLGKALVVSLPYIIKILSVVGTLAMLLVAGGIFNHNIEALHHLSWIQNIGGELVVGLVVGFVAVGLMELKHKFFQPKQ